MEHEEDYLRMSLRELVDHKFLIIAILLTIFIEYVLIIMEDFQNFPSVFASVQLYIVFTIMLILLYRVAFRLRGIVIFNIMTRAYLFIILPIGLLLALYQGYMLEEMFSWWLFVSDFFYILIFSQYLIIAILLAGVKDVMVARVEVST